jgi:hemoglobin
VTATNVLEIEPIRYCVVAVTGAPPARPVGALRAPPEPVCSLTGMPCGSLSDMDRVSLYEFAGGTPAFLKLAAAHHQRCLDDPVLNHPFSHPGHPQHVERLAGYWAEVFGGPADYSGAGAGQSAMLGLHARMQAGDDLGTRFVECFVRAADDAGLPPDPEFRAALRRYMQWAVSDVMVYSPRDAVVPDGLPVPRWSWDGLQPPPGPA